MEKLAINGGEPVRKNPWKVGFPIGEDEKKAVCEVLDNGWISRFRGGNNVRIFERSFAEYCGSEYGIATTSGTTALHTALSALNLSPGDEVIVPSLTFVSTASIILQENAIPIFADISNKTFCMDTEDLERKINSHTKAIIPVHLFGHPADMDNILKLADKYGLYVIEDAAQAHGASIKNKKTGSFGNLGCFSFFQTKNMTCGEGGMVLTNDPELYKQAKLSREHGSPENEKGWYFYDRLGFNYNMTEIQAAIGLVQLGKLNSMNEQRRRNSKFYQEQLSGLDLKFVEDQNDCHNVCHNFPIILPEKFNGKRDLFVKAVSAEGVPIDICYPIPLYKTELFLNKHVLNKFCPEVYSRYGSDFSYKDSNCFNAESVSSRIINLFTDPLLPEDLRSDIAESVKKVINNYEP
ncbi:MAG: DegT/DnrJ/EryC1/StrS family aminotransferase [Candidatus Pacearchaeota archaeon]|jgi:dTDP-4-amino-4,6-dideoxygalactose transaminase